MCSLCLWIGFPARKAGQEGPPHHIPSVIRGMTPCNWRRFPAKSPQIQDQWDTERKEKKRKRRRKEKKNPDGPLPCGFSQFHLCITATQVVISGLTIQRGNRTPRPRQAVNCPRWGIQTLQPGHAWQTVWAEEINPKVVYSIFYNTKKSGIYFGDLP